MGLPMEPSDSQQQDPLPESQAYPATTKQAAAEINGIKTDVMSISFSDKIMIIITQNGRVAQWVTVPLLSDNPTATDPYFQTSNSDDDALLPSTRFQPRVLLGAGGSEREMIGQLYASQIAHAITTKNLGEERPLMLGLGLAKVESGREVFLQIVELVTKVI